MAGSFARYFIEPPNVSRESMERQPRILTTITKSLLSLSGSTARNSMIDTLSEDVLSPEEAARFKYLKNRARAVNKQRNRIAHGIWGYDVAIPDGLILQDLEDSVHYGIGDTPRPLCFVYKSKDFKAIIEDIQQLNGELAFFRPRTVRNFNS